MTMSKTSSGTFSIDSLNIKTNPYSPLFVSDGPGIVNLNQPAIMADGEAYYGVFCNRWSVHVPGGYENLQSNLNENSGLLGKYTLVGYVGDKPVISLQSNQIRGWSIAPFSLNRKVFNVNDFYERLIHGFMAQQTVLESQSSGIGGHTGTTERDRSLTGATT